MQLIVFKINACDGQVKNDSLMYIVHYLFIIHNTSYSVNWGEKKTFTH